MNLKKYTETSIREAVKDSVSKRQVLLKLKVAPYGGNYKTLDKAISFFKIDTSHFTGQNTSGRKLSNRSRPLEEYFSNRFPINSFKLKTRLIRESKLPYICSKCQLKDWQGSPIPLELDHINGNSLDNSFENLRLLCPNCHALTPTYRGKNIKLKFSK